MSQKVKKAGLMEGNYGRVFIIPVIWLDLFCAGLCLDPLRLPHFTLQQSIRVRCKQSGVGQVIVVVRVPQTAGPESGVRLRL